MKIATGTTIVTNGQLIDGTGSPAVPQATLVIKNGLIEFAGPTDQAPTVSADADRIDARGGTIMPGLVEAHFHATYFNIAALEDLDIKRSSSVPLRRAQKSWDAAMNSAPWRKENWQTCW